MSKPPKTEPDKTRTIVEPARQPACTSKAGDATDPPALPPDPVTATVPTAPEPAPRKRFCGKPGRSGPPKGNTNGQRHGMSGGKLPKGCQYIENRVNSLRRQVEAALVAAKGEISIVDAAGVNSVLKWERHGMLAAHWLRKEAEKLSPVERLKFSEAIAKASDARDKAIRSLGIDAPPPSPWSALEGTSK